MSGIVDLHRRVVRRTVEIVGSVPPDDLGRPTPCAAWTLSDLLAHMIAQHRGFAAADRPEPCRCVRRGRRDRRDGIRGRRHLDRSLWLPEIRADEPFAAPVAIGFHLVDCVAHGWDVAAGIGVEAEFEPDLVAAALSIAEQVPTGAAREAPDAAFGPVLPVDAGRSDLDRVLVLLGRSPSWPASALT